MNESRSRARKRLHADTHKRLRRCRCRQTGALNLSAVRRLKVRSRAHDNCAHPGTQAYTGVNQTDNHEDVGFCGATRTGLRFSINWPQFATAVQPLTTIYTTTLTVALNTEPYRGGLATHSPSTKHTHTLKNAKANAISVSRLR